MSPRRGRSCKADANMINSVDNEKIKSKKKHALSIYFSCSLLCHFFLLFFDPVGLMNLPHKQLRAKDTFSASWAWCNASAWTSPESQISRMKRTSTLVQPLENDISFYLKYLKNWLYAPSIAPKCIWRTASERKLWNINHLCNYYRPLVVCRHRVSVHLEEDSQDTKTKIKNVHATEISQLRKKQLSYAQHCSLNYN